MNFIPNCYCVSHYHYYNPFTQGIHTFSTENEQRYKFLSLLWFDYDLNNKTKSNRERARARNRVSDEKKNKQNAI